MAVIKNKQIKNYPFDSTIQTSESKSQHILFSLATGGRIQKSDTDSGGLCVRGLLSEDGWERNSSQRWFCPFIRAGLAKVSEVEPLRLNQNHCSTVPNKCPLPSLPFITPYLGLLPQDHTQISAARGAL